MAEMMKLADKGIKIVVINLINIFKNVQGNMSSIMREIEVIKENWKGTSGGRKHNI
jgi:hypothetical protein